MATLKPAGVNSAVPENPSAIFISHGGGPLPVLDDLDYRAMVKQRLYKERAWNTEIRQ
jgi:hypothetical protein